MGSPAPLSDGWSARLLNAGCFYTRAGLARAAAAEALEWAASRCRVHLEQDSEGAWIGVGGGWEYAAEHFNDEITAKAQEVRDGVPPR